MYENKIVHRFNADWTSCIWMHRFAFAKWFPHTFAECVPNRWWCSGALCDKQLISTQHFINFMWLRSVRDEVNPLSSISFILRYERPPPQIIMCVIHYLAAWAMGIVLINWNFFGFFFQFRLFVSSQFWLAVSQTFQQLSYANAELGQKLIRPTQTTTPGTIDVNYSVATIETEVVTTPKPTGFFSGLRNFFSRNSGATTTARPTSPVPSTRTPIGPAGNSPVATVPQQTIYPASPPQNARTRNGGSNMPIQLTPTTSTTSTTSTPKPSPIDDFPALSPPRRNNHSRPTTHRPAIPSTPVADWTNHGNFNPGSRPSVPQNAWTDIRRRGGSLPNLSMTTSTHRPSYSLPTSKSMSNIHSGGHSNNNNNNKNADTPLATDAEIEALTESLFEKSTPNIFSSINVNLQARTRSSEQSDQAPLP